MAPDRPAFVQQSGQCGPENLKDDGRRYREACGLYNLCPNEISGTVWVLHGQGVWWGALSKKQRRLPLDVHVRPDTVEHEAGRNLREFFGLHFVQASPVHSAF